MSDSILDSIKKVLGIPVEYKVFDADIIMHINSVFSTLHQIGVEVSSNFYIEGSEETWEQFFQGLENLNSVKTYIYLRVKLLFDPPPTSFAITAMEKQITEFEWRLNVEMEGVRRPWPPVQTSPTPL